MNSVNEIPAQILLPSINFAKNQRILEPDRVAPKEPLKYEKKSGNLLGMFKQILPSEELEDGGFTIKTFKLDLKPNTRIIIDGIDYRDITTGQIVRQRHLEIYRNEQGYLVAKKIVNGEIEIKGTFNLTQNSSENNSTANILKSAKYGNFKYTKD